MTHFLYSQHAPHGASRIAASGYWCLEAERCSAAVEAALPDTSVEIYVNLGAAGRWVGEGVPLSPRSAWVAGTRAHTLFISKEIRDCDIVGIRLRPTTARALLKVPASELTNELVDLDTFWGRGTVDVLRERLAAARDHAARFVVVDNVLRRAVISPSLVAEGRRLFEEIARHPARSIRDTAAATGLSHRAVIAFFDEHIGLKPKAFQRVLRLRRALRDIHAPRRETWARIAADAGYYDQSHFIHDFQKLTGFSPIEYDAKRMGVGLGFVRYRLAAP